MNKLLFTLFLLTTFFSTKLPALQEDKYQVTKLPGFGKIQERQMAGHLPVNEGADPYVADENLFYWFVSSATAPTDPTTPLILWLNGGPGSSGFYGFFAENGPYTTSKELTLQPRPFSWSEKAHYLMIEQAPSVGYSYSKPGTHLANEAEAMDKLYYALRAFFQRYPEFAQNPLFIGGESYAGKYLPQLAHRILAEKHPLPLKGILVGDGWVNPLVQQSANAEYAYSHGLVDRANYYKLQQLYSDCAQAIQAATPSSREANRVCKQMQELIRQKSGVDSVDIRTLNEIDYSPITNYLKQDAVRQALHVDPRVLEATLFSSRVNEDLEIGIQDSAAHLYPPLLEAGVLVLIYSGLEDGTDSNFMGTDKWLEEMSWSGQLAFQNSTTFIWKSRDGDVAGSVRQAQGLTQVKIRGAGHLAPMDQPAHVQEMVYRFLFNEGFN